MDRTHRPPLLVSLVTASVVVALLATLVAGCGAPPTAVFAVSDLTIEAAGQEIKPGDPVVVTAKVQNTGGADGTYRADLTIDGSVEAQEAVDVPAGQSAILRFEVRAGPPGDYDVRLGEEALRLRVLAPAAFELSSLVVTPNPAESGGRLEVLVWVANTGGLTGTYPVQLLIDGKVAGTTEATVAGGEETTVAFSVKSPSPGRHTVRAGDVETQLVVWRIERPASGKVLVNKLKGGLGRLTIKNGGDRDGVVILAKTSSPSKTLLAVYVRAGKSATIRGIKDGTYVVFFSTGKRWDGYSKSFTSEQERRRFEDPIAFRTTRTAYTIWTISLMAVAGGNAPTDPVDEGEFPGVP